jgi:2'-5' RNA ligase
VALDLPLVARDALVAWREEALAGRDDLRALPPEALHVTLAFLGYQPEKEIGRIAETAFVAIEGLSAPRLAAAGVKPIPPRRPRLFALDLEDDGGGAVALQAAVAGALAAARFYRPEKRPFWPHVTLARVKSGRRAPPLEAPPPPVGRFEAAKVTLYRSTLRPQGARYDALARVTLAGR